MANTIRVALSVEETIQIIEDRIIDGSITGEEIDRYEIGNGSSKCTVLVFEKHYYRAGNRLTLTVVIDNLENRTRVHMSSGGGGEGLFRFDWGASESFEDEVLNALDKYIQ